MSDAATTKSTAAPTAHRMRDNNFEVASFRYNRWSADLEENQTLQHALDPKFWAGQAPKVMGHDKNRPRGRGDIIEVRKLDSGLYAELLVLEVRENLIHVQLLRQIEPKALDLPVDTPLETRWNLGKKQHEVVRKTDKVVMAGPFPTKNAAHEWIVDHMKAMAA